MKTKLLSLIISLFACSLLVAQEQPIQKVDVNGVYLIPDKMPEYPGGVPAMMKFLSSNVKYPVEAQKNAISGRVIVQFVVMEDGTLSQAKVIPLSVNAFSISSAFSGYFSYIFATNLS